MWIHGVVEVSSSCSYGKKDTKEILTTPFTMEIKYHKVEPRLKKVCKKDIFFGFLNVFLRLVR